MPPASRSTAEHVPDGRTATGTGGGPLRIPCTSPPLAWAVLRLWEHGLKAEWDIGRIIASLKRALSLGHRLLVQEAEMSGQVT